MVRIPDSAQIKFILNLEFPEVRDPRNRREDGTVQLSNERAEQYQALMVELEGLPDDELQRRHNEAHQEYMEALRVAEEARWPFNHPSTKADHTYWAQMPLWSIREAVALSLDRDPVALDKYNMESYTVNSSFAAKFMRQYNLIARTTTAAEISFPIHPVDFVEWGQSRGIELSDAMVTAVLTRYPLEDWKDAFAEEVELHDATRAELDRLKVEIERTGPDGGLAQRERSSCLKLIIGMAVKKYRYDPKAARNSAVTNIANDLNELGIGIDVDTVRKWLKEAAEELPPSQTD
ncbi:hypothetical protein [Xanthobacter oligotrophicus]|uniref:hypothetical protein n=1 Tax=Xanthobacter oligotrophicus TaxID=2607286 RepID=UPI0011F0F678|nr:hypothetical protein [Xanthobacter oligotrophicus]MCG5234205.1 hypothetical protein [Xanthobacter oligotrophicus]